MKANNFDGRKPRPYIYIVRRLAIVEREKRVPRAYCSPNSGQCRTERISPTEKNTLP
jgi:hypothetical protein